MSRHLPTLCGLFLATILSAQCPMGNVNINSQEDVDAYAIAYGSCDTLPGSLNISGFFITDLSAFSNLKMIEGDLTFSNTFPTPSNFLGFGQLQHIGGDFVAEFGRFKNFDGLQQLQRIDGDLRIMDQDSLENFWGLNALQMVGGNFTTSFVSNDLFAPIGLNALDSVHGNMTISVNPNLTSYTIPDQIRYVGGNFAMGGASATSMSGGNNLEHIGGILVLNFTPLTNISAYNSLKRVGSIQIQNNTSLTTISGFALLDTVMNDLQVVNNQSLVNLSGFSQLDVITDQFWIANNPNLTTISGFADLDSIGLLWLDQNPVLTGLQAFNQPIALGALQINGNTQLSLCAVQAVCDRLLASQIPFPTIINNAIGCMTDAEVYDQCELSTGLTDAIIVRAAAYPNPATDVLFIDLDTGKSVYRLFDPQHRLVAAGNLEHGQLDVSALKPGHYFLEIGRQGEVFRTSFIKM